MKKLWNFRILGIVLAALVLFTLPKNTFADWDETVHSQTGCSPNPEGGTNCAGSGTCCDITVTIHHTGDPPSGPEQAYVKMIGATSDPTAETELSPDFYHSTPLSVNNPSGLSVTVTNMYYSKTGSDISTEVAPYVEGIENVDDLP